MPKEYLKNRAKYLRRGYSLRESKRRAAIEWNIAHPNNPNPWTRERKRK